MPICGKKRQAEAEVALWASAAFSGLWLLLKEMLAKF